MASSKVFSRAARYAILLALAAGITLLVPSRPASGEHPSEFTAYSTEGPDSDTGTIDDAVSPVEYHRLRIKLRTTSGGASFRIDNTGFFLTASRKALSGPVRKHGLTLREVWLAPDSAGHSVSILTHFALKSEAAGKSVSGLLKQTGQGATVLQVYKYEGRAYSLIQEERLDEAGSKSVQLDLSELRDQGLIAAVVPRIAEQKMLWAFYYPWYVVPWDTSILLDEPASGYYNSSDLRVIKSHVESAASSKIDGFISSWWGPRDYTDTNLKSLLDIAQDRAFKVMINFETLTQDAEGQTVPLDADTIVAWLSYAISRYAAHPAYMKIDGLPVIVLWASETHSASTWETIFSSLRAKGKDAAYIAMVTGSWPKLDSLDEASGWHTYNILQVIQSADQVPTLLTQVYSRNKRCVRHYPFFLSPSAPRIWCATAQPGYDDHLIPDRTTPILKRRNGALYRETLQAALASDPDWIFLTSWNEWWEHTYIEPSKKYGSLYLQITKQYAEQWKGSAGSED